MNLSFNSEFICVIAIFYKCFLVLFCFVLYRLVHDRELQLYDGTRLIRHDKYDEFISNGWTKDALAASNVHKIHPSFRMIALAEPPTRKFNRNALQ